MTYTQIVSEQPFQFMKYFHSTVSFYLHNISSEQTKEAFFTSYYKNEKSNFRNIKLFAHVM